MLAVCIWCCIMLDANALKWWRERSAGVRQARSKRLRRGRTRCIYFETALRGSVAAHCPGRIAHTLRSGAVSSALASPKTICSESCTREETGGTRYATNGPFRVRLLPSVTRAGRKFKIGIGGHGNAVAQVRSVTCNGWVGFCHPQAMRSKVRRVCFQVRCSKEG